MSEAYFITGALGCIGAWTVKALADRGDSVVVFDLSRDIRRLEAIMEPDALARVRLVEGSLTDRDAVRRALADSGARRVIHLAGLQVPACRRDPPGGALVNVVGTLHVFEAAKEVGVERVVYASSAAVFGPLPDDVVVDERTGTDPRTHYGVFKRANEGSARVYYLDCGLSSVGLRPYTVYGVGRDTGITSDPTKAMKAAVLGRRFHIRFSGLTDFLYVADAAAAFVASADRAPEGAHVFNLHGETIEVGRVVEAIDAGLAPESRGLITFGGPPIPIAATLSDAAFRAAVPGVPSTPLGEGVAETIRRFVALRDAGRLDASDLDA